MSRAGRLQPGPRDCFSRSVNIPGSIPRHRCLNSPGSVCSRAFGAGNVRKSRSSRCRARESRRIRSCRVPEGSGDLSNPIYPAKPSQPWLFPRFRAGAEVGKGRRRSWKSSHCQRHSRFGNVPALRAGTLRIPEKNPFMSGFPRKNGCAVLLPLEISGKNPGSGSWKLQRGRREALDTKRS